MSGDAPRGPRGLVVSGAHPEIVDAVAALAVERGWRVAVLSDIACQQDLVGAGFDVEGNAELAVNLSDPSSIESAFAGITAQWGRAPDAVVHCTNPSHTAAAVTESASEWDANQADELRAAFLVAQAGAREMLRLRGARAELGSVVLVGSLAGSRGAVRSSGVSRATADGGLVGMARQLAVEWGGDGIRVNAVQAGGLDPQFRNNPDYLARVPLRRAAAPREVAEVCQFLVSEASSYVTGVVLPVDGGLLAA